MRTMTRLAGLMVVPVMACASCVGDIEEAVQPAPSELYYRACSTWLTTDTISEPRLVFEATYDDARHPTSFRSYDDDGALARAETFRYSSGFLLIDHTDDRDGDGVLDHERACEAEDERGRCVLQRDVVLGREEDYTYAFTYDDQDRILERRQDRESDGVWESIFTWAYEGQTMRWSDERRDPLTDTWRVNGGVVVRRGDDATSRIEYWSVDPVTSERTESVVTYTYGARDELLEVSSEDTLERRTYDPNLRPLSVERTATSSGEVLLKQTWSYDDDARTGTMLEVEGDDRQAERTSYDEEGRRRSTLQDRDGDGYFEVEIVYDMRQRMTSFRHELGDVDTQDIAQITRNTYDDAGNVLTREEVAEDGDVIVSRRMYAHDYGCFEGEDPR